jgi:hypothetical protein
MTTPSSRTGTLRVWSITNMGVTLLDQAGVKAKVGKRKERPRAPIEPKRAPHELKRRPEADATPVERMRFRRYYQNVSLGFESRHKNRFEALG